jgi:CRP-like cAMP-binding protein
MSEPGGADWEVLKQVPIFAGMPETVLARIREAARLIDVKKGDELIREGSLAMGLYVVKTGELEIAKRGRNGSEYCLAVLRPGDCVGEMSLIDIQPRSATVRALQDGAMYVLDQGAIAKLYATDLEAYAMLVMNIAREISRRLRSADQALVDMGMAVEGRWLKDLPL